VRRLIQNDFNTAFKQCDVLLGPTAPTTAFKLGEKAQSPMTMYLSDIFTLAVNLAGVPALSLNVGFDVQKLPIGAQLIGPFGSDAKLLGLAAHYQRRHPETIQGLMP
jgi:aspartyl-tRNA(Asn)/glutamyl-tRNA(Gln) amidotransferase subunit A